MRWVQKPIECATVCKGGSTNKFADVRCLMLKEWNRLRRIKVYSLRTHEMIADIFTKALGKLDFDVPQSLHTHAVISCGLSRAALPFSSTHLMTAEAWPHERGLQPSLPQRGNLPAEHSLVGYLTAHSFRGRAFAHSFLPLTKKKKKKKPTPIIPGKYREKRA